MVGAARDVSDASRPGGAGTLAFPAGLASVLQPDCVGGVKDCAPPVSRSPVDSCGIDVQLGCVPARKVKRSLSVRGTNELGAPPKTSVILWPPCATIASASPDVTSVLG